MTQNGRVRVEIRIKPTPDDILDVYHPHRITIGEKSFTFDYIHLADTTHSEIFSMTIKEMVDRFLNSFNCTVFAYGQTGSGKTHTMGLSFETLEKYENSDVVDYYGIIPDSISYIFDQKKEEDQVYCTFIEVYNEEVIDLLSGYRTALSLRQMNGEMNISGSREMRIENKTDAIKVVKKGILDRTVKSTKMNILSSRSHAIFTVILHKQNKTGHTVSKFTFVDLAGSERLKRTEALGQTAKESISINGGLLALSNVITALSRKCDFVPYRDSKLTRILQHGLGGNSITLMLANISGSNKDVHETCNTLKYAQRATNICNDVKRGVEIDLGRMSVLDLKKEILRLKSENAGLKNALKGKVREKDEGKLNELIYENNRLKERLRKIENAKTIAECKFSDRNPDIEILAISTDRNNNVCEKVSDLPDMDLISNKNGNLPEKGLHFTNKEYDLSDINSVRNKSHDLSEKGLHFTDKEYDLSDMHSVKNKSRDLPGKGLNFTNKEYDLPDIKSVKKNSHKLHNKEHNINDVNLIRNENQSLPDDELNFTYKNISSVNICDTNQNVNKSVSNCYAENSINMDFSNKSEKPGINISNNHHCINVDGKSNLGKENIIPVIQDSKKRKKVVKFSLELNQYRTYDKDPFIANLVFNTKPVEPPVINSRTTYITVSEPFINSLSHDNTFLYCSTLNGSIFRINKKTHLEEKLLKEDDSIKKIIVLEQNILYTYKNTVKRFNGFASEILVSLHDEVTDIHLKQDHLCIGTNRGVLSIYTFMNSHAPVYEKQIHDASILSIECINNILYTASRDHRIGFVNSSTSGHLNHPHYSSVEKLLPFEDKVISLGRDGCIKIFKDYTIVKNLTSAHSGWIKTGCIGQDSFFTGGKDGVLKEWVFKDRELIEVGRMDFRSSINCMVYDKEDRMVYSGCMNSHIYRTELIN